MLLFFTDGIMWKIIFGRWIMDLDKNIEIVMAAQEMAYYIASVHIKTWQSTYKGIMPEDFLKGLSIEKKLVFIDLIMIC